MTLELFPFPVQKKKVKKIFKKALLLVHAFKKRKGDPFQLVSKIRHIYNCCTHHVVCYERNTSYDFQLIELFSQLLKTNFICY